MAARSELPPPGWHDDPWFPGARRYWDGERWTGHVIAPAEDAASGGATRWSHPAGATRDAVWDLLWNPKLWPSWIPWLGAVARTGEGSRGWRLTGHIGASAFAAEATVEVTLRREVRVRIEQLTIDGVPAQAGWDVRLELADGDEGLRLDLHAGASAPEAGAAAEELLNALSSAAARRKRFVSAVLERPKVQRVSRRDEDGNRPPGAATMAFKVGWGRRK